MARSRSATRLREADTVKDEADNRLLVEQTDVLDVPAPYYEILSLTGAHQ